MIALTILPFQHGAPIFPEGFNPSGWSPRQELLDKDGNPIKALVSVQITEEEYTKANEKFWPEIDWCYRLPVEDDVSNLSVAAARAMEAENLFLVKLNALTNDGYYDPELNIKLKCTKEKIAENWTPQCLIALLAKVGGAPGETLIETFDYDDKVVTVTLDNYLQLMSRMGMYYFSKFKQAAE